MAVLPRLVRLHPPEPGDRVGLHTLGARTTTLGRENDCAIRIPADGVSRHHARVEKVPGHLALRVFDLGSRNGTWVDGLRVDSMGADLLPGHLLRLGDALFVYRPWSDEEVSVAGLPPLPGPVNTRFPPLILALRRVQELRGDGLPIWVTGDLGSGRSVVVDHLRAIAGTAPGAAWVHGGEVDIRSVDHAPPGASPDRVLHIPRLQERPEDVLLLVGQLSGLASVRLVPRLLEGLHLYDWPGNVRELRIALARASHPRFGSMPGAAWDLADFPDVFHFVREHGIVEDRPEPLPAELSGQASGPVSAVDASGLRKHLDACRWRIHEASLRLGCDRHHLLARMLELGIRGPTLGTNLA